MYTPEEFAQKMKLRGYVRYIADARRYAKQTGKESFDEQDLEDAYHALNTNTLGREYISDMIDGERVLYKRDRYDDMYWRDDCE